MLQLMKCYFKAEKAMKVSTVPLIRYLHEKLDVGGDVVNLALAAAVFRSNGRYRFDEMHNIPSIPFPAAECKLMPRFSDMNTAAMW